MLVDIEEDGVAAAAAPGDTSSSERVESSSSPLPPPSSPSAEAIREQDDRVGDGGGRGKQVREVDNTSGEDVAFFCSDEWICLVLFGVMLVVILNGGWWSVY